jgi:hypothetical protein
VTDIDRLGQRGSYRLGRLRIQGTAPVGPPPPRQPTFRRRHRGPTSLWLLGAAAGVAAIAAGAMAGLWFVPFAVGLITGAAGRPGGWRGRVLAPAVAVLAVAGWGIPLGWPSVRGEPAGATARVITELAGLHVAVPAGIPLTLLGAVLQALAGLSLGWAATARPRRVGPPAPAPAGQEPTGLPDAAQAGAAQAGAAQAGAAQAEAGVAKAGAGSEAS